MPDQTSGPWTWTHVQGQPVTFAPPPILPVDPWSAPVLVILDRGNHAGRRYCIVPARYAYPWGDAPTGWIDPDNHSPFVSPVIAFAYPADLLPDDLKA